MFSKFWNTNARPEGWLGRFALRMMNLTHTPMAQWNLSFIDFQPDWTILDVGCGGGKNIARMLKRCPQGQVYGIDYSEESVAMSRKKNKSLLGSRCFIEQGNVMELPYETGKYDLVTAHYKQGKVDEEFTLSYTRCGLCELARKRGHLDILPAMCRTDYITFEAMGAILHRNKTLASGDDCCLYYMTKPGSEAEQRWQDEHPDGTFISK